MKDGPNIVGIAALIGDHARAEVLTALMADRALTATELAAGAGVTKQTISAHLAKLVAAGLVAVESQGRHRYFRLADRDVAHLIESLMGVAFRTGAVRVRASPREPALRRARVCYDHLAGEVGVAVTDRFIELGALEPESLALLDARPLEAIGIHAAQLTGRRPMTRACLDWTERRPHVAGQVGAAILTALLDLRWLKRAPAGRAVQLTQSGRKGLHSSLGLRT